MGFLIPYLFVDKEDTIQTEKWFSHLSANPNDYKNCVVKTVTHVKNLRSPVVHEYLQAIVEHTETGTRTRVIAERQNTQDQVIIGRWGSKKTSSMVPMALLSSSSSSSGPISDLPLPLYTLSFRDNKFKLLDLAKILDKTTKAGGRYNIINRHCYWFARTAYTSFQKRFRCFEERCVFGWMRGLLIVPKKPAEPLAQRFNEERANTMERALEPAEISESDWNFLEAAYKDSIRSQADSSDEAKELQENLTTIVRNDFSMDRTSTISVMKDAVNPASLSDDLGVDAAYEAASKDSDSSKYIEVYNYYAKNQEVEEGEAPEGSDVALTPEDFSVLAPKPAEAKKIDYVVKVLVGHVLDEYRRDQLS